VSATDPADRGRDPLSPAGDTRDDGESSLPRAVRTWPRAYALVLAALAADILLFWLLGAIYGRGGGGPA
jgi:hypothetical protein